MKDERFHKAIELQEKVSELCGQALAEGLKHADIIFSLGMNQIILYLLSNADETLVECSNEAMLTAFRDLKRDFHSLDDIVDQEARAIMLKTLMRIGLTK